MGRTLCYVIGERLSPLYAVGGFIQDEGICPGFQLTASVSSPAPSGLHALRQCQFGSVNGPAPHFHPTSIPLEAYKSNYADDMSADPTLDDDR